MGFPVSYIYFFGFFFVFFISFLLQLPNLFALFSVCIFALCISIGLAVPWPMAYLAMSQCVLRVLNRIPVVEEKCSITSILSLFRH